MQSEREILTPSEISTKAEGPTENHAKLAAMGHLMAGIAHEINTPLGAINAAIGSLKMLQWEVSDLIRKVFASLNTAEQELFFQLIRECAESNLFLSTREQRAKKAELKQQLAEEFKSENAAQIAESLSEIRFNGDLSHYSPLILHSEATSIFTLGVKLANQFQCTRNIELAVEKAISIVFAMKAYFNGKQHDEFVFVHLQDNLETMLTLYHHQMKTGIELIRSYPDHQVTVMGCPNELYQVWTNLIHNSIQAMNGQGILEISIEETNDRIVVKISDNGPGIPEAIQPKIFDQYFTTKEIGVGTGLGLSIVKQIVEKHHGNISFNTSTNGTEFIVQLPGVKANS